MAFNPAKQGEALNSPVERASQLNDPQFENQQGYFPYDLTHQEFITPRFGEITPTMNLDTVPGDRTVVRDNTKLILNQINGNFLSNINQYVDSFYVPLRNVFPNNYEKLIPNPAKGEGLPNSALPMVPFLAYIRDFYRSDYAAMYGTTEDPAEMRTLSELSDSLVDETASNNITNFTAEEFSWYIGRMTLLATVLSRGQLLDYLGIQFDTLKLNATLSSDLQRVIDAYFSRLWQFTLYIKQRGIEGLYSIELPLTSDIIPLGSNNYDYFSITDLSHFRSDVADTFEAGRFLEYRMSEDFTWNDLVDEDPDELMNLGNALTDLLNVLDSIFLVDYDVAREDVDQFDAIDVEADPWEKGDCINIGKILAYQQVVAHYYSNDHVDNVFSSDLFMQNLRSVMFPTERESVITREPVFLMNGVHYEYDYISYGGFYAALLWWNNSGLLSRQYVWATLMLLMRRSLRYGDYFSTARPNMLAVSDQLSINVIDGMVSPIDVTKNLLMQRYLNAANYIGQGYLQYMSSIYGIKPSDTGCIPRFISHRRIPVENQITNNTADDQGKQTTNLVAYSDDSAFDVFIDDFGYVISLTSFDVLPVYKSGIDSSYHFADRFDYFNPMLQGIGDQPIRSSEMLGNPALFENVFGYTMRNAEYKYKLSKAHGAFCNSLPGFMLSYPLNAYSAEEYDLHINPDFIRDKPVYLDPLIPQMTGISPAEYFHFICSCTNQVHCARKIQATPGVLF